MTMNSTSTNQPIPDAFRLIDVTTDKTYSLNGVELKIVGFHDEHTAILRGSLGEIKLPIEAFCSK